MGCWAWVQAVPIGKMTGFGMGSPRFCGFWSIPSTDNPLIPFGLRPGEYRIIDKAGRARDVLIGFALTENMPAGNSKETSSGVGQLYTQTIHLQVENSHRQSEFGAWASSLNWRASLLAVSK